MSNKSLSEYTYGELLDELKRRRYEVLRAGIPEVTNVSPKTIDTVVASTAMQETLEQHGVYGATYAGAENTCVIGILTPRGAPIRYDQETQSVGLAPDLTPERLQEGLQQWGLMREQAHQLAEKVDACCEKIANLVGPDNAQVLGELRDHVASEPLDTTDHDAVERRLDDVEQTIDLLLRRNQINGVIGLCAGRQSRGSCLIANPVLANADTRATHEGLLQEIALAHQLNHMVVQIGEGTAEHFQYTLDVARRTGADVDKILESLAEAEARLSATRTQHSKSKFARPNPNAKTDKLN